MRQGKHFIADGFRDDNLRNPAAPRRINMENGNYKSNMKITDVQIMYTAAESGEVDVSNSTVFFVLSRTEQGATPLAGNTQSSRSYGLRFQDPDCIAWGILDQRIHQVILSPYNIVPQDMFVNCWSFTSGGDFIPNQNAMGYAITMEMEKSSATEALLQTVNSVAQNRN